MKINRSERTISVILFFLALIVFSLAQEQSRVIERAYNGKWNLQAGQLDKPAKQTAPIAGPVQVTPVNQD